MISMSGAASSDQALRETALIHEVEEASDIIKVRLPAAGFDDMSLYEALILGVMAMGAIHGAAKIELTRGLGISPSIASASIDSLITHGYLDRRVAVASRGGPATAVSARGSAALAVIADVVAAQRWARFAFRPGDIVISTLRKSGTTWLQMICALLIFQTQDLPAPMSVLSPWMESDSHTRDQLYGQLAGQQHRRFIKSHLALSDMPVLDTEATFLVMARNPLDAAVSFYYQEDNYEKARSRLRGQESPPPARPAAREWLLDWITDESPVLNAGSLRYAMWHLAAAWKHRDAPNVVLMHYDDLCADLEGQMRHLAAQLGILVPETRWPGLVSAATLAGMRAIADRVQPLQDGVLAEPAAFFRRGSSGAGQELLTAEELAGYHARAIELAPADLLAWLHRDGGAGVTRPMRRGHS
jgi:aryl sulfotransferase